MGRWDLPSQLNKSLCRSAPLPFPLYARARVVHFSPVQLIHDGWSVGSDRESWSTIWARHGGLCPCVIGRKGTDDFEGNAVWKNESRRAINGADVRLDWIGLRDGLD